VCGTAKQHAGLATPGQHGELIDGGNDEIGQLLVDLLVDEEDGQTLARALGLGEEALGAGAVHDRARVLRLAGGALFVHQLDVLDANRLATPRALRKWKRRLFASAREVVERGVHLFEAIRRRPSPHPEPHGEACVAETPRVTPAHLFEGAE
jgi:hypothetical protein